MMGTSRKEALAYDPVVKYFENNLNFNEENGINKSNDAILSSMFKDILPEGHLEIDFMQNKDSYFIMAGFVS